MRILHIITSLRTGGAEHLMVDLLPRLRDLGNEVELLLFDGTRTPFYEQLEATGIPIHQLTLGGNVYNPLNIFRLMRYMRGVDIIHTHNTACQLFVPMAKMLNFGKAKLFTTEHNTTNRRRGNKVLRLLDKWMYNRYERIICISDKAQDNLEQHIGQHSSIYTIYNGIDTQRFLRTIKDISAKTEFIVTMVAGFRPQKDQDTLIRAMALLPDNFRLWLVGDGERRSGLESLIAELGLLNRVNLLGIRTDIPDILEQSDICVLSSHWEGLSLSSIECMASGRPFVASDVAGLHEIVAGHGVLFAEGCSEMLASSIRQLCENPIQYKKVATQCQQQAQNFDISIMANKYNELYMATRS